MNFMLAKLFFIFLLIFSCFESKAKDPSRFSFGVGIFNYMEDGTEPHKDQSNMVNLEIHSGKKMFNLNFLKKMSNYLEKIVLAKQPI